MPPNRTRGRRNRRPRAEKALTTERGQAQCSGPRGDAEKLDQPEGDRRRSISGRNEIVEPAFAQPNMFMAFVSSCCGAAKVSGEWSLVCMTQNLLKLFRLNPASVTG